MNSPEIVRLDAGNVDLLITFISKIGKAGDTFRYFEKRTVAVINNHLVTFLLLFEELPVAYGHLELEDKTVWLGICVLPDYSGKGFGNIMMNGLIDKAKELNIQSIDLTVDKINLAGVKLYEKFNFKKLTEGGSYDRYQLIL